MNHESLFFAGKTPLAAHLRGGENPHLWIFASRTAAEQFASTLPFNERRTFSRFVQNLGDGVFSAQFTAEGEIARRLSERIMDLHESGFQEFNGLNCPFLCGFWPPEAEGPPGYGFLMWIEASESPFHAVIVRSRNQARQVLRNLPWLRDRPKKLLNQIRSWNVVERVPGVPCHVEGPIAKLLCDAAVYRKIMGALGGAKLRKQTEK